MSRANSFLVILAIGFSLLLGAVAGGAPAVLAGWLSPARADNQPPRDDLMARLASPTPSQTAQPSPTSTPPPDPTVTVSATPEPVTPTPSPTRTPTPAPTAVPSPTAGAEPVSAVEEGPEEPEPVMLVVTVEGNLNVRSGPGLEYLAIDFVSSGVEAEVIGRNAAATWALARVPDRGLTGWINASPSFVAISGDLLSAPVVEPGS
jgi:hypothetical protein